ncbi:hypothetical protein [Roseicitreum antarcticum]|uniref:hypothetical protein n=1 Tax=Roseicitreum antarcticum TaxID=564137 RepID=UPI001CC1F311|nr:hypothetical protein [Roseicitreum antarcticum]
MQSDTTFQFMPADTRASTHQNCLDVAQQVLDRAPTVGLAHLVQAVAFDGLGRAQERDRALAVSQAHASFEGWQAIRRIRVGLPALDTLSTDARAALSADIAFLMIERWGIEQIAPLFISLPDAREFIESVAQQAKPQSQRQLISALRRYAQG